MKSVRVLGVVFAGAVLVLIGTLRVQAWGAEGHHVVARIAWSRMTDAAKRDALDLLGRDDFVAAATWADEIRQGRPQTYNWHFVDIPYGAAAYDAKRDCPPTARGDCILAELARAQHDLGDAALARGARAEALRFLIHFVGDLHQPLHDIDNHDKGGNDVRVEISGRRLTNLHAIWDSGITNTIGEREEPYAQSLIADLEAHPVAVPAIDYTGWALEGHAIAITDVYTYPGFTPAGPPLVTVKMDESYLTKNRPIVDRRLQLAGVRLAAVLNQTLR